MREVMRETLHQGFSIYLCVNSERTTHQRDMFTSKQTWQLKYPRAVRRRDYDEQYIVWCLWCTINYWDLRKIMQLWIWCKEKSVYWRSLQCQRSSVNTGCVGVMWHTKRHETCSAETHQNCVELEIKHRSWTQTEILSWRENEEAAEGVAEQRIVVEGVVGKEAKVHHVLDLQLQHQSPRHVSGSSVFVVLAQVHEVLAVLVQMNTHVVAVTAVGGGSEADVVGAFDRSREHTCD